MEIPNTEIEALELTIRKWRRLAETGQMGTAGYENCPLCAFYGYKGSGSIIYELPDCNKCCLTKCTNHGSEYALWVGSVSEGDRKKYAQQIVDRCTDRLEKIYVDEKIKGGGKLWICPRASVCDSTFCLAIKPHSGYILCHTSGREGCPDCIHWIPEAKKDEPKWYSVKTQVEFMTQGEAEKEAERLSLLGHRKFYVFKAVKSCEPVEPKFKWEIIP